jgi:hypothetical protein
VLILACVEGSTVTVDFSRIQDHPPLPYELNPLNRNVSWTNPLVTPFPPANEDRPMVRIRTIFLKLEGTPARIVKYGSSGRYDRRRIPLEYGRDILGGDVLFIQGMDAAGRLQGKTYIPYPPQVNMDVRVYLFDTNFQRTQLRIGGAPDYGVVIPQNLAPGQYAIVADTPAHFVEPVVFYVPGAGRQDYVLVASSSATMHYKQGNAGVARVRLSGDPLPAPLRNRPPTAPSAAWQPQGTTWQSPDFYWQQVTAVDTMGVEAPTYTPDGDLTVANEQNYYLKQVMKGNRLAIRGGPRGVATTPVTLVDGHISPVRRLMTRGGVEKSFGGNLYAISTCGYVDFFLFSFVEQKAIY